MLYLKLGEGTKIRLGASPNSARFLLFSTRFPEKFLLLEQRHDLLGKDGGVVSGVFSSRFGGSGGIFFEVRFGRFGFDPRVFEIALGGRRRAHFILLLGKLVVGRGARRGTLETFPNLFVE